MNENIRVSDADRERVAEQLREHYAAGRLSSDELDERVSAALTAKTYAELRAVMADLPEPELAGPPSGQRSPGWRPEWQPRYYRRRPRLLPLALLMLLLFVVLPGAGFVLFAIVIKAILLLFVVLCVAGLFTAGRFRRRARRYWR